MKFSIVIPLYNKVDYVEETLQSLANQTRLPDEIIIVDDKSTDGSLQKVKTYFEEYNSLFHNVYVEIIELAQNNGIGYTRNIGFEKTTGDIVSFLDADDIYEPELINIAHDLMLNHNIDLLVLGVRTFPGNRALPELSKISDHLNTHYFGGLSNKPSFKDYNLTGLLFGTGKQCYSEKEISVTCKIYRTENIL